MTKKNNWSASGFGKFVSPELVSDEFLDAEVVLLMQGTNLFGDLIYSYLKASGRNLKLMFGKMQKGDNFLPSDFGTVLAAGRGEPTEEVREEMRATYNMVDVPMPKRAPNPAFSQPKFFDEEG
jgi:hypothetical protein